MEAITNDELKEEEKIDLGLSEEKKGENKTQSELVDVGTVDLKPKGEYTVGKCKLPPWTPTPARAVQFEEVRKRNAMRNELKKLEKEKIKQEKDALLEIEKIKIELRRREILQEAEKLRKLIQTAASVDISTNPNSLTQVQTHVDISDTDKTVTAPVKSETRMSNTKRLEIEEVPVDPSSKRVAFDDDSYTPKRKVAEYEQEDEDDTSYSARPAYSVPPRASTHTHSSHRMERYEEPHGYGAGNHSRSKQLSSVDDEVDYEYQQILAEAKQRVIERRREAAMQRAIEEEKYKEVIRQEKMKAARPSEATRYLEHTQNTTQQQFSQKVVAKSEEGFIWM